MKYLFLLSEKFYKLILWEWKILKILRRQRRKNILLRGSFFLLSLLSIFILIFLPPFIISYLIGIKIRLSIFFIWFWILNLKFF